ncbi:hypothetical protein [Nitrosopumilus sp. b2]|nr:hypothetical protein [Nitrosopumilus sp. b2]KAF6244594.1 hypothetical protein C6989_09350 [Nitrosopumilus sp. b2]
MFGFFSITTAFAEVDPLTEVSFMKTGTLHTNENKFQISNEITVREFFNGKIIRISGQTLEGFPYITYSKILNDDIQTHGIIFVGGKFVKLSFEETLPQKDELEKEDNLQILVQYTQRVHSQKTAHVDIKVYDPTQNKLNDFNLNYGFLANTSIEVIVLDEDGKKFHSSTGFTNNKGLFETEFYIPERYPRETLTVTINAEDQDSKSSKILQIFTLGAVPEHGSSP